MYRVILETLDKEEIKRYDVKTLEKAEKKAEMIPVKEGEQTRIYNIGEFGAWWNNGQKM